MLHLLCESTTTLVQLGQTVCRDAEQFKAWSQNLGHEGVLTTFLSYGAVVPRRQGQIIQTLTMGDGQQRGEAGMVAQAVLQAMRGAGMLGGQDRRMQVATGHHRGLGESAGPAK